MARRATLDAHTLPAASLLLEVLDAVVVRADAHITKHTFTCARWEHQLFRDGISATRKDVLQLLGALFEVVLETEPATSVDKLGLAAA